MDIYHTCHWIGLWGLLTNDIRCLTNVVAMLFDEVTKGNSVTLGFDVDDCACGSSGQGKDERNEGELHCDCLGGDGI